jgi:hypothetical protein
LLKEGQLRYLRGGLRQFLQACKLFLSRCLAKSIELGVLVAQQSFWTVARVSNLMNPRCIALCLPVKLDNAALIQNHDPVVLDDTPKAMGDRQDSAPGKLATMASPKSDLRLLLDPQRGNLLADCPRNQLICGVVHASWSCKQRKQNFRPRSIPGRCFVHQKNLRSLQQGTSHA